MKNKFLLMLLAIVCVICCVFAFVACDPDNPNNPNSGDDADKTDVTAEKWSEVLTAMSSANNITNYTFSAEGLATIEMEGNKLHIKDANHEGYLAKEGDEYFSYDKDIATGTWTKESIALDDYNYTMNAYKQYIVLSSTVLKDKFESFTYADGAYTAASLDLGESFGEVKNVKIVFKNNALVSAQFTVTMQGEEIVYSVKNIGTTSLTLPNVQVSVTNEVTEQQWKSALSQSAFTNFTATATQTGLDMDFILKVDLAHAVYYFNDNNNAEYYFACQAGNYYRYKKGATDAKFKREQVEQSYYEKQLTSMEQLAPMYFYDGYSLFTYNQDTKSYFASGVKIEGNGSYNVEAKFENGKLVYAKVELAKDVYLTINYVYGKTSIALPQDYTEGEEVSQAQWQEGLSAFAQGKNFHLVLSVSGKTVGEVKLDGDKYYDNGGVERILVKDGSNYYRYDRWDEKSNWSKSNSSKAEYNSIVNENALNLVLGGTQALLQNYSSFEYADGKYTAKVLEVSEELILKDVQVIFSHGSVAMIVCTKVDVKGDDPDTLVTIDGIGVTSIALPNVGGGSSGVACPIKNGEVLSVPVGTSVAELYKEYPELITEDGKWELYLYTEKGWIKLEDEDTIPSEDKFQCKLKYTGKDKAEDVEFMIVGRANGGNPQPDQGNQVSEEQWQAALSLEAFANVTIDSEHRPDGASIIIRSCLNGDIPAIYYFYVEDDYNEEEFYSKEKDGKYYYYTLNFDKNVYERSEMKRCESVSGLLEEALPEYLLWYLEVFANCKSNFVFENDSYYAEEFVGDDGGLTLYDVRLQFVKGKLIYLKAYTKQHDEGSRVTATFSMYGETIVELPQDYVDEDNTNIQAGNEVTEQQWEQILLAVDNYTYTQSFSGTILTHKVANSMWQQSDSTGMFNQIMVCEDNVYYVYSQDYDTKGWMKMPVEGEEGAYAYYLAFNLLGLFADEYEAFDYVDGKYIANEVDKKDDFGEVFLNVKVTFENGQLIMAEFVVDGDVKFEYYNFNSTEITLPDAYTEVGGGTVKCPINNGQVIKVPVGTLVSELYATYPGLTNDNGKWVLSMYMYGSWFEPGESQGLPSAQEYQCKLAYNGAGEADVVEFTLIGLAACPFTETGIEAPVGTPVSAFYQGYPYLVTDYGTWELYIYSDGDWVKLDKTDVLPEGEFQYKLVFEGANVVIKPVDYEFTIVGTSNGDDEPFDGNEVTEQQWQAAFDGVTSFTMIISTQEATVQETRYDGDKLLMIQNNGAAQRLYSKEGDNYYCYVYNEDGWTKATETEENYTQAVSGTVAVMTVLKEQYSEEAYANGAYTIAEIESLGITDVKVIFKEENIIDISYKQTMPIGEGQVIELESVIYNIGSTTVELPTDYTEQN